MNTTTTSTTTNLLQTNGHPKSATSRTLARIRLTQSNAASAANSSRKQFSSFILFLSVIILVNLCPFQSDFEPTSSDNQQQQQVTSSTNNQQYLTTENKQQTMAKQFDKTATLSSWYPSQHILVGHVETCLEFVKLMFKSPMRLGKRTTRFTLAEARVLGKMAKVWYIKKKIKKLSKKLKKHTIAVPVFTAIPIYEHSYYPQPHVTHVTHGGMHHAASSYSPTLAQMAAATTGSVASTAAAGQQMATSASNNHHMATYRMAPAAGNGPPAAHQHAAGMYHHHHHHQQPGQMHSAGQIINAYAPSPALYVDEAGGLYGTYGNAYGRYDGGYHYW